MFQLQADIADAMAKAWQLRGSRLTRWRRIIAGTEIDQRHGVIPVQEAIHLTTAQRMRLYEQFAPALATQAAERALANAAISADCITDLIVVSCTGFSAPGVDVALVESLGLRPTVRRTVIGFMGCYGAINGLRAAIGACAANANVGATALVVCVELCSLHIRADADVQNQVASALFADGAAAAIVASKPSINSDRSLTSSPFHPVASSYSARLTLGRSLLLPLGRDWMTWRVTDAGFAMTLSREVPGALKECIADFVDHASATSDKSGGARTFIVHPGGPGILDAVDEALQLRGGCGLEHSRAVLRRCGNMSSATVLFVLDEALGQGCEMPAMLLAFGPGLTIEGMSLLPMR